MSRIVWSPAKMIIPRTFVENVVASLVTIAVAPRIRHLRRLSLPYTFGRILTQILAQTIVEMLVKTFVKLEELVK